MAETAKSPKTTPVVLITLKALCAELKLDAREAREKLRVATRDAKKFPDLHKAHKPGQPWTWQKDSPALKDARAALTA